MGNGDPLVEARAVVEVDVCGQHQHRPRADSAGSGHPSNTAPGCLPLLGLEGLDQELMKGCQIASLWLVSSVSFNYKSQIHQDMPHELLWHISVDL